MGKDTTRVLLVAIFLVAFSSFCLPMAGAESLDQTLEKIGEEMRKEKTDPDVPEPVPVAQKDISRLREELEKARRELKRARLSSLSAANVSREARSASLSVKTAAEGYETALQETKTAAVETQKTAGEVKTAVEGLQKQLADLGGSVNWQGAVSLDRFWLTLVLVLVCFGVTLFWITRSKNAIIETLTRCLASRK